MASTSGFNGAKPPYSPTPPSGSPPSSPKTGCKTAPPSQQNSENFSPTMSPMTDLRHKFDLKPGDEEDMAAATSSWSRERLTVFAGEALKLLAQAASGGLGEDPASMVASARSSFRNSTSTAPHGVTPRPPKRISQDGLSSTVTGGGSSFDLTDQTTPPSGGIGSGSEEVMIPTQTDLDGTTSTTAGSVIPPSSIVVSAPPDPPATRSQPHSPVPDPETPRTDGDYILSPSDVGTSVSHPTNNSFATEPYRSPVEALGSGVTGSPRQGSSTILTTPAASSMSNSTRGQMTPSSNGSVGAASMVGIEVQPPSQMHTPLDPACAPPPPDEETGENSVSPTRSSAEVVSINAHAPPTTILRNMNLDNSFAIGEVGMMEESAEYPHSYMQSMKLNQTANRTEIGFININNYICLEEIGRGANSVVFHGQKLTDSGEFERDVAIKIIPRDRLSGRKTKLAANKSPSCSPLVSGIAGQISPATTPQVQCLPGLGRGNTPSPIPQGAPAAPSVLQHEIAVMKKVKHEHVMRLIEAIDDNDHQYIYLIMPFADGPCLRRGRPTDHNYISISEHTALKYMKQIARGLHYLHHHDIVHQDIKPDNILLGKPAEGGQGCERVYIADFGVADFTDSGDRLEGDLIHCRRVGTIAFHAPELYRTGFEENMVNKKSLDIWALGITFYMMITGVLPFTKDPTIENPDDQVKNALDPNDQHYTRDYIERITKEDVVIPDYYVRTHQASMLSVHLLKSLLARDPKKRCTALELLKHRSLRSANHRLFAALEANKRDSTTEDDVDDLTMLLSPNSKADAEADNTDIHVTEEDIYSAFTQKKSGTQQMPKSFSHSNLFASFPPSLSSSPIPSPAFGYLPGAAGGSNSGSQTALLAGGTGLATGVVATLGGASGSSNSSTSSPFRATVTPAQAAGQSHSHSHETMSITSASPDEAPVLPLRRLVPAGSSSTSGSDLASSRSPQQ